VDATHYRAILLQAGDARAARNVSKMLQDAQRSGIVSVGQFLEYIKGLRAAGSREGEARADSSGSVQIMTVHQAKGLEFGVVVIGDAGSTPRGGGDVILDSVLGVVPHVERNKYVPLAWQLAHKREERKEDAENKRLLYVAATRAKELLIVSAHVKAKPAGELTAGGWLKALCDSAGVARIPPGFQPDGNCALELACAPLAHWPLDAAVCGTVYAANYVPVLVPPASLAVEEPLDDTQEPGLLAPIPMDAGEPAVDGGGRRPNRVWRVAPHAEARWAPAWVVGKLVHAAIAAWRWPDDPDFDAWCRANARGHGLVDGPRLDDAVHRTRRPLTQLRRHPLYAEIDAADERHHELPFVSFDGREPDGRIDLLFRHVDTWTLVDFKTDRIRDERDRAAVQDERGYRAQVKRYTAAVQHYLGATPRCLLCLLDDRGATSVIPIDQAPVSAGNTTTSPTAASVDSAHCHTALPA
jgi:hypothetical protein